MTDQNDVETAPAESTTAATITSSDDSFDAFYRREYEGQLRRAVLLLGSEADAKEAVAQSFTNIFERWSKLDNPGPYLNRAVLNACRDIGRRRTRLRIVESPPEGHAHSGDSSAESSELIEALLALPYKQRAVVVLKHWAGLRERDIAEQLDIAAGSVGPTLARAYRRLKPILQEVPE